MINLKKVMGIVILLSVAWTGCGKEEVDSDRGGFVDYVISWDMTSWDPSTNYDNTSIALSNIYEPLLWYYQKGDSVSFIPALAERYSSSEDGLDWIFELRKGVKFHNGEKLTASAVKQSIERTIQMGQGASWIWDPVKEINVTGEHLLELKLKYEAPMDLIVSSGFGAWILCPERSKDLNSDWFQEGNGCGTGPYTLRTWVPGQQVVLEHFPDYWGGWSDTQAKRATIRTVSEVSTQIQLIRSGRTDIVRQIPFEILEQIEKDQNLNVVVYPSFESIVGLLNTRKKPTDDLNVRRAVSSAVDYHNIVGELLSGYGSKPRGPVVGTLWGSLEETVPFQYSLSQAETLFNSSEYPNQDLSLSLSYASGEELLRNIALTLQSSLRRVGVRLDIEVYPWSIQWERGRNLDTAPNIFLFYWWPTYPTPYDPLLGMFHTEEQVLYNLSYYSNNEFDSLIEKAHKISGTDKYAATKLFRQAQQILLNDVPALFLADLKRVFVTQKRIKGFSPNPAYPNVVFFYELSPE